MYRVAGSENHEPHGLRFFEHSQHEMSNVGPRNHESASEILLVRGPVNAGQRPIGQARRSHDGPVKAALPHHVLQQGKIGVVSEEDGFYQWTEQGNA